MHYALMAAGFMLFAFIAPLKVTLMVGFTILLVVAAVALAARLVTGMDVSVGEAVKGVGLSAFFVALVVSATMSFSRGAPEVAAVRVSGGLLLYLGFWGAYLLGFRLAMGLSFVQSLIVGLVPAALSIGVLTLAGRLA